jgi:primosomal protein N' (replication factor Y) (superfamily II helicase)
VTHYAEVAVPVPVEGPFHYLVPEALREKIALGQRVRVPFGKRALHGVVTELSPAPPEACAVTLRPILELCETMPVVTPEVLKLARFASSYYQASLGDVLKLAFPPKLATQAGPPRVERFRLRVVAPVDASDLTLSRAPQQRSLVELLQAGINDSTELKARLGAAPFRRALLALEKRGVLVREPGEIELSSHPAPSTSPTPTLTEEQARAFLSVSSAMGAPESRFFLLHGVTGSGKTEVYLRIIQEARKRNRSALVLVPEIALTPQLAERFEHRFPGEVAILHSSLSDGARCHAFREVASGAKRIVLGTRSAIWAPLLDLGVIVIDEEHDGSYKQNTDVRYHARDLALVRARYTHAQVVLGSATPSLETLYMVETDRAQRLRLRLRVEGRSLPHIKMVDLGGEARKTIQQGRILSQPLIHGLLACIERKEQAILFLNRRGFNTVVICDQCTAPRGCPHCATSLTLHKPRTLTCHHCDRRESLEAPCPACGGRSMTPLGAGTQRVVEELLTAIPHARVLRLDRDSTTRRGELQDVLARFRRGEADVLVGTQMVTKGHDFQNVTLVGVVLADAQLAFPDFRSGERTFQLITQVAGRAGRGDLPGTVYIQTFQPDHYALTLALHHDVDGFYETEKRHREALGYPPFGRVGLVRLESKNETKLRRILDEARPKLAAISQKTGARILGPATAPLAKVRDRHRAMAMIRAATPARLAQAMLLTRKELEPFRSSDVFVLFDVDAVDFL